MNFEQAVEAADETKARSILAADPELRDRCADLATRMAEAGNWSAVRLLVDLGFDVNGLSSAGATALHYAAAAGETAIARLLVEHGADHTVRDPQYKAEPAGWAQFFKKRETQTFLESLA